MTTEPKPRLCINCSALTHNVAFCDTCLRTDARPSYVIGGEQHEAYELAREEYLESLPPLL
jgi:hypothetical protein